MKKVITVLLVALLFSLCGCGKAYSEPVSADATASTAIDEDFAISEIAKEWQTRNAPIFLRGDFYDPYAEQVGDEFRIDLGKAFAAIDLRVSFNASEETMIVTPVNELGVIMFQFSLHCVPYKEENLFRCTEFYYDFVHTNSDSSEFLYCYYYESPPPTDEMPYFIGRVGENIIYFPADVFAEIDSTIGTMMMVTDDDVQPQDFTDLGPSDTL